MSPFIVALIFVVVWLLLIYISTPKEVKEQNKTKRESKTALSAKWLPKTAEERFLVSTNLVESSNELYGKFLVNFREAETDLEGNALFGNDPLEASITPRNGRLSVTWDNGFTAVIGADALNIFTIDGTN